MDPKVPTGSKYTKHEGGQCLSLTEFADFAEFAKITLQRCTPNLFRINNLRMAGGLPYEAKSAAATPPGRSQ